jgi:DNA-directed RNA polymerase subunit E"
MAVEKACKKCKAIFEGSKCPKCGSEEFTDTPKGKILILKPAESEVAKNLKINEKGAFAVKVR